MLERDIQEYRPQICASTGEAGPVRSARISDIHAMTSLVSQSLEISDRADHLFIQSEWYRYYVIETPTGELGAIAALIPAGQRFFKIFGLQVGPTEQGKGYASALIKHLIERADALNANLVCTTQYPDFFRRFGFEDAVYYPQMPDTEAPEKTPEGENQTTIELCLHPPILATEHPPLTAQLPTDCDLASSSI